VNSVNFRHDEISVRMNGCSIEVGSIDLGKTEAQQEEAFSDRYTFFFHPISMVFRSVVKEVPPILDEAEIANKLLCNYPPILRVPMDLASLPISTVRG
jgi:hypothetical protein